MVFRMVDNERIDGHADTCGEVQACGLTGGLPLINLSFAFSISHPPRWYYAIDFNRQALQCPAIFLVTPGFLELYRSLRHSMVYHCFPLINCRRSTKRHQRQLINITLWEWHDPSLQPSFLISKFDWLLRLLCGTNT